MATRAFNQGEGFNAYNTGSHIYSIHDGDRFHVYTGDKTKKNRMAQMKLLYIFAQAFGWTAWLGGVLANLGNIKSVILFVLGVVAAILTIWSKWLDVKKNGLRSKRKNIDTLVGTHS